MKVKLISYTPNPDMTVYKAARTCYQAGTIDEIAEPTQEQLEKFIRGLMKSGHHSPIEHISFTFAVEGISRVVSHELVRHRIASYSQQSQRYVNYRDKNIIDDMYIPKEIQMIPEASEMYKRAIRISCTIYNELIEMGLKPQDARYVLPNATPTQVICTMNARTLLNFFGLRCCRRAQPEMQELAFAMLAEVKKVAPVIFATAGRQCATCTEVHRPKECER